MLTDLQVAQYNSDGFVTPDYRVPEQVPAQIREAHTRLVAQHPEFASDDSRQPRHVFSCWQNVFVSSARGARIDAATLEDDPNTFRAKPSERLMRLVF